MTPQPTLYEQFMALVTTQEPVTLFLSNGVKLSGTVTHCDTTKRT